MKQKTSAAIIMALLALAIPASADWQTASVGIGDGQLAVAVDPVRNRIFTANNTSGTVSVINGRTNQVQTWTAGTNPVSMVVNPLNGRLYVAVDPAGTSDSVVVFDTLGNIVNRLLVGAEPYVMALDLDSNRLFVANQNGASVCVFQNEIFLTNVTTKDYPNCMAINPVNRTLYLANVTSDSVACIDMDALTISHVYSGARALQVAVCPSVNKAYVTNSDEDSVSVINCATNTVTAKIQVDNAPYRIVCDPGAKRAYLQYSGANLVTAINCSTDTKQYDSPVSSNRSIMALNSVTGKLYVSAQASNPVLVIVNGQSGSVDSMVLAHPVRFLAANPVTNKTYVVMVCSGNDSLAVIDGSDYDTTIVAAGTNTYDVAVNPVTGDAYFTNRLSDNVTVIKANGDVSTIAVGNDPRALAVNPLTNKVFVCNMAGASVSVIDGASYAVERTIPVDTDPTVIAINPLTNYIYVNSYTAGFDRIKVIDGKDWDTTSIQIGNKPFSIAVNPVTNRIYAGADISNNVTVIDGAHHTVITTISSITRPYKIEVNPITNKIYCAGMATSGKVYAIDGATNTATTINVGNWPDGLAVDLVGNKVYVSNYNDNTVSEIDGATNTVTATLPVGTHPWGLAADPATGQAFACNFSSSSVSIIDCATSSVRTITTPSGPQYAAVNPVNGKVYVACNAASGKALVIDQTVEQDTKINTYNLYTNDWITGATQMLGGKTVNNWSPYNTRITGALFSLATAQSFWRYADTAFTIGSTLYWNTPYQWGADTLLYGENVYRIYSLEAQGAAANNLGTGTPFTGNIENTVLYRIDGYYPTIAWWDSLPDDNDSTNGYGPYPVKAVIIDFSGVDSAVLGYGVTGKVKNGLYVTMTRAQADTFFADIPQQDPGPGDTATVDYYIKAWDHANSTNNNAGNSSTSNTRTFRIRNLTGVAGQPTVPALPKAFALQPCRPNPARSSATIAYQLPKASSVTLEIYSITGQLVKRFDEGIKQPGYYSVRWDAAGRGAGVYFYRLRARLCQGSDGQAGEWQSTRKLVVIK